MALPALRTVCNSQGSDVASSYVVEARRKGIHIFVCDVAVPQVSSNVQQTPGRAIGFVKLREEG